MRSLCALAVCSLAVVLVSAADEKKAEPTKKEEPAVREIDLTDVKVPAKEAGKWAEPTVFKSEDELKKAFGDSANEIKVDFKKEYLALFQWSGSGQDKLTHAVETKDGKITVTSTLTPGRTRDLRPHAHLIAVPAGAEWKAGK